MGLRKGEKDQVRARRTSTLMMSGDPPFFSLFERSGTAAKRWFTTVIWERRKKKSSWWIPFKLLPPLPLEFIKGFGNFSHRPKYDDTLDIYEILLHQHTTFFPFFSFFFCKLYNNKKKKKERELWALKKIKKIYLYLSTYKWPFLGWPSSPGAIGQSPSTVNGLHCQPEEMEEAAWRLLLTNLKRKFKRPTNVDGFFTLRQLIVQLVSSSSSSSLANL